MRMMLVHVMAFAAGHVSLSISHGQEQARPLPKATILRFIYSRVIIHKSRACVDLAVTNNCNSSMYEYLHYIYNRASQQQQQLKLSSPNISRRHRLHSHHLQPPPPPPLVCVYLISFIEYRIWLSLSGLSLSLCSFHAVNAISSSRKAEGLLEGGERELCLMLLLAGDELWHWMERERERTRASGQIRQQQ